MEVLTGEGGNGGPLEVFDLGVLLQALAQSLKVGTLRVSSRYGEKYVCFQGGRLEAIYTRRSRIRLGRILYNLRVIEKADLESVFEDQKAGKVSRTLGEELIARGRIGQDDLNRAVRYQMIEELLEIFYWKDYSYEFIAGPPERSLHSVSSRFTRVGGSHSVEDLLLSVAQIIDQMERFNQILPSVRDIYELTVDPRDYLARAGRTQALLELLSLIDGRRDIREILRDMRMHRFEVMALLSRLRMEEIIRPKNAIELLLLAENQKSVFSDEKLARVYERVQGLSMEGFDVSFRLAEVHERLGNREKAAAQFMEHADRATANGDLEAAEEGARRALEIFPESTQIRRVLADILDKLGRAGEQVEELRILADLHRARGEREMEEWALERALSILPNDPELKTAHAASLQALGQDAEAGREYACLARSYREAGKPDAALEAISKALDARPDALSLRRERLKLLIRDASGNAISEEFAELVDRLEERCRASGHTPVPALAALHRWLVREGIDDRDSVRSLARALTSSGAPDIAARILLKAARHDREDGRNEDACSLLRQAVEFNPECTEARTALAEALVEEGQLDAAVLEMARVAVQKKSVADFDTAGEIYERMVEVAPLSPNTWQSLAEFLEERGCDPEAADAYARVGQLYRTAGRADLAAGCFDRACGLAPDRPDLLRELAQTLALALDIDRSVESYVGLISLLRASGDHAGAIAAGFQALERGSPTDLIAEQLRDSHRELGEELEARL